jgi:hypothetical protein
MICRVSSLGTRARLLTRHRPLRQLVTSRQMRAPAWNHWHLLHPVIYEPFEMLQSAYLMYRERSQMLELARVRKVDRSNSGQPADGWVQQ